MTAFRAASTSCLSPNHSGVFLEGVDCVFARRVCLCKIDPALERTSSLTPRLQQLLNSLERQIPLCSRWQRQRYANSTQKQV